MELRAGVRRRVTRPECDNPIGGAEIGRPFSRTIEDQQLVLDEHRFGHDGTDAARPGDQSDCRNQMPRKARDRAHAILARSWHVQEMPTNYEFAMHGSGTRVSCEMVAKTPAAASKRCEPEAALRRFIDAA